MSEQSAVLIEIEALPAHLQSTPASATSAVRWFELCLVMLVVFGNSILSAIYMLRGGAASVGGVDNLRWTMKIVEEVAALLLLGYVLSRRGKRIRDLGLRWSWRDLVRGRVIFIATFVTYYISSYLLAWVHHAFIHEAAAGVSARQAFGHPSLMMGVMFLINPFFEELIVRAYLMTEVRALTGSWTLAVVASTAVQTSYHLYYGWVSALAMGVTFLMMSIYFARTGRATPVIFSRSLSDWISFLWLR